MREIVQNVVTREIITIPALAILLDTNPALVHRWIVTESVCEYEYVGKNIVIDKLDIGLVRDRVELGKGRRNKNKIGNSNVE